MSIVHLLVLLPVHLFLFFLYPTFSCSHDAKNSIVVCEKGVHAQLFVHATVELTPKGQNGPLQRCRNVNTEMRFIIQVIHNILVDIRPLALGTATVPASFIHLLGLAMLGCVRCLIVDVNKCTLDVGKRLQLDLHKHKKRTR